MLESTGKYNSLAQFQFWKNVERGIILLLLFSFALLHKEFMPIKANQKGFNCSFIFR
jgi:hypothetical protein